MARNSHTREERRGVIVFSDVRSNLFKEEAFHGHKRIP